MEQLSLAARKKRKEGGGRKRVPQIKSTAEGGFAKLHLFHSNYYFVRRFPLSAPSSYVGTPPNSIVSLASVLILIQKECPALTVVG